MTYNWHKTNNSPDSLNVERTSMNKGSNIWNDIHQDTHTSKGEKEK